MKNYKINAGVAPCLAAFATCAVQIFSTAVAQPAIIKDYQNQERRCSELKKTAQFVSPFGSLYIVDFKKATFSRIASCSAERPVKLNRQHYRTGPSGSRMLEFWSKASMPTYDESWHQLLQENPPSNEERVTCSSSRTYEGPYYPTLGSDGWRWIAGDEQKTHGPRTAIRCFKQGPDEILGSYLFAIEKSEIVVYGTFINGSIRRWVFASKILRK